MIMRSLLFLIFVLPMSCMDGKPDQIENKEASFCEDEVLIKLKHRIIRLYDPDFEIFRHDRSFDLKFTNDSMITFLRGQKISEVQFCLDSVYGVAKPLHIFSSHVPEASDYFFPVIDSGYTCIWTDGNFEFREISN